MAVATIGIMHFNKKADVTNAMLRIADSLAYVAAARHVYFVVDDAEVEKRRLFVKAKNNLAPDTKALSYMTGMRKVGFDKACEKEIWAPYVEWGGLSMSRSPPMTPCTPRPGPKAPSQNCVTPRNSCWTD